MSSVNSKIQLCCYLTPIIFQKKNWEKQIFGSELIVSPIWVASGVKLDYPDLTKAKFSFFYHRHFMGQKQHLWDVSFSETMSRQTPLIWNLKSLSTQEWKTFTEMKTLLWIQCANSVSVLFTDTVILHETWQSRPND